MKIICVGRNYADHAKELGNDVPTEPMLFMKPATALLREGKPFFYPDFTKNLHYEAEIVLRICKNGKHIAPNFAAKYYDQLTIGIDFTARDVQDRLKSKGHPWEIAKAFDHSAVLGEMIAATDVNLAEIHFSLQKNGETVQNGDTRDLIFDFNVLISHISKYFSLNTGDLIYTGTPAGVGPVAVGNVLTGFIGDKKLMVCEVK
jgi:2-keto-4-pentenoate hydratase/2-oxohepta-3-ene-1,7-dioic acid hydratase in catechol pathway